MREKSRLVLFAVFAATIANSCASCDGPGLAPNRCKSVELEHSKGKPYDLIRVKIEPEERFDELEWVRVETSDGHRWPVDAFRDDGGTPYIRVPLHPGGIEGGSVEMEFATSEKKSCPIVDFEIEPLPEAPGTTAEVVEKFEEAFNAQADMLGLPANDVASTVTYEDEKIVIDQPPRGYMLGVAYWILAHPDNEKSVAEFVATADEDALRVSDAVFARLGTVEALERDIEQAQRLSDLQWMDTESSSGGLLFSTKKAEIEHVDELVDLYDRGHQSCKTRSLNDDIGDALGIGNTVTGLASSGLKAGAAKAAGAGLVSEGSAAAAGTASAVGAAAVGSFVGVWASISAYQSMECAVFPARLDSNLTVSIDSKIEEDKENPQPVDKIEGGASSGDATSFPARILDIVTNMFGVARGVKGAATAKGAFDDLDPNAQQAVIEWAAGAMVSKSGQLGSKMFDREKLQEIGGYTWSGIDFDDTAHVGTTTSTQVLVPDPCGQFHCFSTTEIGEDTVGLFTRLSSFEGSQATGSASTRVRAIQVDVGPSYQFVEPGQQFDLDWSIKHAVDTELKWEASYPLIREDTTNDFWGTKSWKLPESEDAYPIHIRADSTSDTGLRSKEEAEPRFGATILDLGDITVFPSGRCVRPGKTVQFQVVVENRQAAEIEWEPGALVDENGVFTAPSGGELEFEVQATAKWQGGREESDIATVTVSPECACWYSISVFGDINFSHLQKFGIQTAKAKGEVEGYTHGTNIAFSNWPDVRNGSAELQNYANLNLYHDGRELRSGFHFGDLNVRNTIGFGHTGIVREDDYVAGNVAMTLENEREELYAFAFLEFRFVDDAGLGPSVTCQSEEQFELRDPDAEPKDYWPFD